MFNEGFLIFLIFSLILSFVRQKINISLVFEKYSFFILVSFLVFFKREIFFEGESFKNIIKVMFILHPIFKGLSKIYLERIAYYFLTTLFILDVSIGAAPMVLIVGLISSLFLRELFYQVFTWVLSLLSFSFYFLMVNEKSSIGQVCFFVTTFLFVFLMGFLFFEDQRRNKKRDFVVQKVILYLFFPFFYFFKLMTIHWEGISFLKKKSLWDLIL